MCCVCKVASLTWNATENAEYYIVTAETNSGHKVQLSTNDTWTYISELLCGEEYFLSVEAVDPECRSQSSQPLKLKSGWFYRINEFEIELCLSKFSY